ncbi:HIT domain-containing protein [Candidatus Woesearchaeota archaeon]|nr:HIT domain-containing protein [Candidatus Woesearchaeota archaeon]
MPQDEQLSPEQVKQQCIFCHIIAGDVAAKKVFEDDKVVAVLDINPATPGHVLLLTKEHYAIMPQVPDDVIGHIGQVSKACSHAMLKAMKIDGTTIFVANGMAAGQRAQHFMVHIIPRNEGDGVGVNAFEGSVLPAATMTKLSQALAPAVKKILNFEAPVTTSPQPKVEKNETRDKPSLDDIAALLQKK